MLPAAARLTGSQDFALVVRRGRRAGRPRLVVHALPAPGRRPGPGERDTGRDTGTSPTRDGVQPTRVGFVVSKAVGKAVVRHRVLRRLRHVLRTRLAMLPPGTMLVVRALPPAADASSAELAADVDAALRRLRLLPDGTRGGAAGAA
ncbi:ribonuclease P protein component [Longimycelium tulufanense]|uniref:Ribonuclease P protein component n=1 Tax=Longimycelium tulufanense TaxID=907463 RepID=A0A8J3CHF7_9PSEU|nr:ribonuclease P protein component [Longimycelium tulufanense]GGM77886.1 ribonuclease P protein component [Longimycelium tulufanense]